MDDLERFKEIFSGLSTAYGVTKKTNEFDARGKHKTKSFIFKEKPAKHLWQAHLDGKEPALGIIPINEDSKCRWSCIDIDLYNGFDHQQLIKKIRDKNLPLVVFRSKSGGAHVFLFTKDFVPASLLRDKLKEIASVLGYAKSEIFPKQNILRTDRGDTGSFLNLPYHNCKNTMRYAFNDNGEALTLHGFFSFYEKKKQTEEQVLSLIIKKEEKKDDLLKGAPPCLISLANEGIPNGQRNNAMYNFGVYLKKRFPESWQTEIFEYNKKYCLPPLDKKEIDILIKSIDKKDYNYKCKDEPIASFCNSTKCVFQEFGVGDGGPGPEIKELKKYESDPPIYYVLIGEDTVEVDINTLLDPFKFSVACAEQINQPIATVGRNIWIKMLQKLFKEMIPIPAPESTKIDVQLKELLAEFITKSTGKEKEDILRGLTFTEEGKSYFKAKDFWDFLQRKKWNLSKHKTIRLLETSFDAVFPKLRINKKEQRVTEIKTMKLDKPNVRTTKLKKPDFA